MCADERDMKYVFNQPLNDGVTLAVNLTPIYTREYHLRLWLGVQLVRLAAWVWGCRVRFDHDEEGEGEL